MITITNQNKSVTVARGQGTDRRGWDGLGFNHAWMSAWTFPRLAE